MKRPAFQFYPSDWMKEQRLRLCSVAARGLWMDMLCLMHDGEPYGHLSADGVPTRPAELAKFVGESVPTIKRLLAELSARGVFSTAEDGAMFSRRMVRDEHLRAVRAAGGQGGAEHGIKGAEHGHKGGRPKKDKGGFEYDTRGDKKPPLPANEKPPPSSSSSSAEGSEDKSSANIDILNDPDGAAWKCARLILAERCGMNDAQSGRFFGKLLADHRLQARDMMGTLATLSVNGSLDGKAYLAKAASAIGARRADPRLSSSQLAARSNIQ